MTVSGWVGALFYLMYLYLGTKKDICEESWKRVDAPQVEKSYKIISKEFGPHKATDRFKIIVNLSTSGQRELSKVMFCLNSSRPFSHSLILIFMSPPSGKHVNHLDVHVRDVRRKPLLWNALGHIYAKFCGEVVHIHSGTTIWIYCIRHVICKKD